ncbi:hypothetical protein P8452_32453 [Trifolium repens]|nr:hypothetical protein P8452_32453 [Trifolium repens]
MCWKLAETMDSRLRPWISYSDQASKLASQQSYVPNLHHKTLIPYLPTTHHNLRIQTGNNWLQDSKNENCTKLKFAFL